MVSLETQQPKYNFLIILKQFAFLRTSGCSGKVVVKSQSLEERATSSMIIGERGSFDLYKFSYFLFFKFCLIDK